VYDRDIKLLPSSSNFRGSSSSVKLTANLAFSKITVGIFGIYHFYEIFI
jgi:hypothetical protein